MNYAERIFVVLDEEVSYNLCPGGRGGWGYLNTNTEQHKINHQNGGRSVSLKYDMKELGRKGGLSCFLKHGPIPRAEKPFLGRKHSDDTKNRIRMSHMGKHDGKLNSQYGTMWITDGNKNKKISKESSIPSGWMKGRKCPRN